MIELTIPTSTLRAARALAATRDRRERLEGVHITQQYIEASDGHVAARFEMPHGTPAVDAILPNTLLDPALKAAGRKSDIIRIELDDDGVCRAIVAGATFAARRDTGLRFPDLTLAAPRDAPCAPSVYDPHLVSRILDAMVVYQGGKVGGVACYTSKQIMQHGNAAGVVFDQRDARMIGLIMPVRGEVMAHDDPEYLARVARWLK